MTELEIRSREFEASLIETIQKGMLFLRCVLIHMSDRQPKESKAQVKLDSLMTVKEVAAFLHVTPRTVFKWFNEGTLPGMKFAGEPRFDRDEIIKHAKERERNK